MNSAEILALAKTIIALGNQRTELPKSLVYQTVEIDANAQYPISIAGDYVYVETIALNGTFTSLTLTPAQGAAVEVKAAGSHCEFPTPFTSVMIRNPNAAKGTIGVWVGFGRVRKDIPTVQRIGGTLVRSSAEIQRPNNVTPYASGQYVSANPGLAVTLNVFRTGGGTARLRKARLMKKSLTTANAAFRLYLLDPIFAAGLTVNDQVAMPLTYATWARKIVAVLDFPAFTVEGAGDAAYSEIADIDISLVSGDSQLTLAAILVARAAYVPTANEKFDLTIDVDQN